MLVHIYVLLSARQLIILPIQIEVLVLLSTLTFFFLFYASFFLAKNLDMAFKNQSEQVMNENPTNIPKCPPTFPSNVISDSVEYSVNIVLNGSSDLKFFVLDGKLNDKSNASLLGLLEMLWPCSFSESRMNSLT